MDKKDLQKKLNKPYSTENWQEVVQFVFPNVQILNPPIVIPIDNDKVELFRQLGNVQLHDSKTLALFELKLKENVNIIRNRVELNNIVSQYIDQDQTHGVLSIFEQGNDDYRFTFSAKSSEFDIDEGDFKTTKTDTKRFTYVLGKNESCKTPAQRFFELSENKSKAEIKDIENAFSVEKLSKAFFKEYKDQYTAFVNYMMQTPGIFKAIYSEDDKAIRDFVKILLGRIIFIKFVQKKGWMGVDATSKKWNDGDYRFLENGFTNFKHQDLFYSTFLEPLFTALDEPNRPNNIFTVTNTRVPYLSGGLFELEDKKTKNINFPANYFGGLFEFLDKYNFTIDENDTNDHEVGIDPEMLGHIFENLLEDNKDKGAFYTPKEIVRYMCQESLKEYLKTSLENNKQWPSDEAEAKDFEQALHNFVTKKEAGGIIEFEETIARALKDVKICDPAIGSGAFPMGLLNEIFQLVHKLHEANKDKVERVWELKGWQPNLVKQNIIQNSIYGVDIEKGAVDVARLRFWLSLIVDEPEPKALPHLDYKIVVGNSLVSKLDDTIIDIDWNLDEMQQGFFGSSLAQERAEILQKISDKQKAVFDPNSDEEKLSLEIRNLKIDLLCKQLELMINNQNIPKEPKIADYQNKTKAKFVHDQAKYFETVGWKQQIAKLEKLKKQPEAPLHFFDWKLDFPEIMNEQVTDKVGFDIVIGNPPYGAKFSEVDKQFFKYRFKNKDSETESYILFIELGGNLQKNKGSLWYIIPSNISTNSSYNSIRRFTLDSYTLLMIIDLGSNIFESATVDSCIFAFSNQIYKSPKLKCGKISSKISAKFEHILFDQKYFLTTPQNIFNFYINIETSDLIEKIQSITTNKLSDFINFSRGIEYGYSSNYVYDNEGTNRKPLIAGRCFNRYMLSFENKFIEVDFTDTSNFKSTSIYENPKIFVKRIGKEIIAYLDSENYYNVCDVYNLLPNSKEVDLFEILGIINSKFINYFFRNFFKNAKVLFPKIPIKYLKEIPIKLSNGKISKLAKSIQEKVKEGKETSNLEQQIDNLVYKLYELTYDEVLVVEPEFSERMSKVEYESLLVE